MSHIDGNYKYNWAIPFNKHTPPIWMTFNKCPGGIFEACPGGLKTNSNEGKGSFYVSLIVSRGKSTTNYGIQGINFYFY